MAGRRFILQVSGRHASSDLTGIGYAADSIRLSTVLRVNVRDQAALQGLLRRVHDLGLALVDLHEAPSPRHRPGAEREYEVTVEGPLGEAVETTLSDYIGPIHVSSRYSFSDAAFMGDVLTRLLDRGAELEHSGEQEDAQDASATGA